jgi:hypothetical protein
MSPPIRTLCALILEALLGCIYIIFEPNPLLQAGAFIVLLSIFFSNNHLNQEKAKAPHTLVISTYLLSTILLTLLNYHLPYLEVMSLGLCIELLILGSATSRPLRPIQYFGHLLLYLFLVSVLRLITLPPPLSGVVIALCSGMSVETPVYTSFSRWQTVALYGTLIIVFSAAIALALSLTHG